MYAPRSGTQNVSVYGQPIHLAPDIFLFRPRGFGNTVNGGRGILELFICPDPPLHCPDTAVSPEIIQLRVLSAVETSCVARIESISYPSPVAPDAVPRDAAAVPGLSVGVKASSVSVLRGVPTPKGEASGRAAQVSLARC